MKIYPKSLSPKNALPSNNSSHSTELFTGQTSYICLNVPWETESPTKIIHTLVLLPPLFQDVSLCTLMILAP